MPAKRAGLAGGLLVALFATSSAAASVPHTVQPGETMWSIASQSNLTTRTLAAANGLPESAALPLGSTVQIPSESEGAAAIGASAGSAQTASTPVGAPASDGGPPAAGAYTVQPGETLSSIAAASGTGADQIAAMNGLSADAPLLAGTVLKLPSGANGATQAATTSTGEPVVPQASPQPSQGSVTEGEIQQIAAEQGVPGDLAAAIAWQESGFSNSVVSGANARGVMQVLPGTWSWVEGNLAGRTLDPSSPQENVRAGTMYLGQLLQDSGGDQSRAIASYYQGAGSVNSIGMLPETERYVENVQALRSRFGG